MQRTYSCYQSVQHSLRATVLLDLLELRAIHVRMQHACSYLRMLNSRRRRQASHTLGFFSRCRQHTVALLPAQEYQPVRILLNR